jgi:hypothetical protein
MRELAVFIIIASTFISCTQGASNQMTNKKFKEADNTAVFTTKFVIIHKKDITFVTHDKEDGAWQFFSDDHFDDFEKVAKVVGLGEIIKLDKTLLELADMPEGFSAHRKFKGDKWIIQEKQ